MQDFGQKIILNMPAENIPVNTHLGIQIQHIRNADILDAV